VLGGGLFTPLTARIVRLGVRIGMRLAVRNPERVDALIVQNAVAHEEGLGPL